MNEQRNAKMREWRHAYFNFYYHNHMTAREIINNERLNRTGSLNLSNQSLTEVPFEVFSLPHLPHLTHLDLSGNEIKGQGLVKLVAMKNLTHLDLRQNPTNPADIKGLTRALPNCRIMF